METSNMTPSKIGLQILSQGFYFAFDRIMKQQNPPTEASGRAQAVKEVAASWGVDRQHVYIALRKC